MASEQTFSTHDLRSGAKEFSRDKDHRTKWAHGTSYGPGRRAEENRPRPARVIPTPKSVYTRTLYSSKEANFGLRVVHSAAAGNRQKARVAVKNDINYASGDSSADEDVEEASAAPVPDAEITYSYDADKGPSHGSQILGQALAAAIERYEVRQTDKLIKEEYEVLGADGEAVAAGSSKAGEKAVHADEEDYEFVEV